MELMLAITEYNYFKPVARVPAERSNHNSSLDWGRNKECTSITVIAGIVPEASILLTEELSYFCHAMMTVGVYF